MGDDELNAVDMIAVREAEAAARGVEALEDRLRAAMRVTAGHWLLAQAGRNDGRALRAACAGVCLALGVEHPDARRVAREHTQFARLSRALDALRAGVVVDMDSVLGDESAAEPVGLLVLWREVCAEKGFG